MFGYPIDKQVLVERRRLSEMQRTRRERRRAAGALLSFAQLLVGLTLVGVSLGLMLLAGFGVGPWDVLHDGLSRRMGVSIGWVVIGLSAVVLLLWLPLAQRPGVGTVANVIVVGLAVEGTLAVVDPPQQLTARVVLLAGGVVLNGFATALYLRAGMGPGPRDGLMTGLARGRSSIRLVRTIIEALVLVVGWCLGGTVGVGTALYAVSVGPLIQAFMSALARVGSSQEPISPAGH